MNSFYRLLFLFLLIPFNSYSQDEYFSKQEEKYFKKRKTVFHEMQKPEEILNFSSYGVYVDSLKDFTPFTNINDRQKLIDSLKSISKSEFYEGIRKDDILKIATDGNMQVVLYTDGKYDDEYYGQKGYWLAIHENNKWNKWYTGLSANMPLHLKYNSSLPLIKNKDTLQIEAAFVRLTQQEDLPDSPGVYKLVKDGLTVHFILDSVQFDADRDGLTNIEEKKLMLNPLDADTDNDRIADFPDMNPRFISEKTNVSEVFEVILQCISDPLICKDTVIKAGIMNPIRKASDTTRTYLIVSDNADLQKINPQKSRFIILSSDDYKLYKTMYSNTLLQCYVTPFFQVDEKENTRKIHIMCGPDEFVFAVTRHRYVWEIKVLSIKTS